MLADDLDVGFAEFVRVFQRPVYSAVLRACGHAVDAEDLAAETFLRAYRALRGYDRRRIMALQPRAWLMTVALNTWRNQVRDRARQPSEVPLDGEVEPRSATDPVADTVSRLEDRRLLATLVVGLPAAQRLALVLRYVCDLSVVEVAEAIGCPAGTAKSHVSRGLRRLRAEHAVRELYEVPR
ncbi:sigma-70 family RNA polymerase sigma factor [Solihabitans fulvus]|uniref:Sigma-70 family RNA polymerase sigma factor n=2 Tax=Solihabitans fulvus TaxID=1892852 RepID=A0A5B2X4R9_9PSEU|nr:sigma-70 family RNA polymerase sigma factor [Solihabitans fulvus]